MQIHKSIDSMFWAMLLSSGCLQTGPAPDEHQENVARMEQSLNGQVDSGCQGEAPCTFFGLGWSFGGCRPKECVGADLQYVPTQIVAPFDGTEQTLALGINDLGWIVGNYHNGHYTLGFLLKQGQFVSIGGPFGAVNDVIAMGINLRGTIVGRYDTQDSATHGFLLRDGQYTVIDFPSAEYTDARAINDQEDIAGSYKDERGFHGFVRTRSGFKSIDVPFAGAHDTRASGINSFGQIVGDYTAEDGRDRGFLFHNGHFFRLDAPGATQTQPVGINDIGQIVGTNFIFQHGCFSHLSWTPGSPTPDWAAPVAVNNRGALLVLAANTNPGQAYGLLATPKRPSF